jgi:MFS family permease
MDEKEPSRLRSVIACNLGICMEGFDFIVYSFFSFVFARLFFPSGNELIGLLLAFATFGLAYVARPLGGIFWGVYADKAGRRPALVWISLLMAVGVALIAVAPTYAAVGIAGPIILIVARLIQGFSAGGEFAGATAMLVEYAPPNRRGLYASTQMASQVFTVAAVSVLLLVMTATMAPAAIESWGWRAVFAFGVLIGPVGFYMRSRMAESPEFARLVRLPGGPAKTPLRDVFRRYPWESLCMAGLVVVGSSAFYLILIFLPIYAARALGVAMFDSQIATIVGCLVQFVFVFVAAGLSDRYGRRAVLMPATIAYVLLAYPLFAYLIANPSFTTLLVVQCVANVILGFISGPLPAALSELFPTRIRSSGIGIVYNVVGAIFGGLGPFLITTLLAVTGDKASPAYWAAATGIVGLIAVYCMKYVRTGATVESDATTVPPLGAQTMR